MRREEYVERIYGGFYHLSNFLSPPEEGPPTDGDASDKDSNDDNGSDIDISDRMGSALHDAIDTLMPALEFELEGINPLQPFDRGEEEEEEEVVGVCTNCFHYLRRLPTPGNWSDPSGAKMYTVRICCNCPPSCSSDEEVGCDADAEADTDGADRDHGNDGGGEPPLPPPPLPPSSLLAFAYYHLHLLDPADSYCLKKSLEMSPSFAPSRLLLANFKREEAKGGDMSEGDDFMCEYALVGRDAGLLRRGIKKKVDNLGILEDESDSC